MISYVLARPSSSSIDSLLYARLGLVLLGENDLSQFTQRSFFYRIPSQESRHYKRRRFNFRNHPVVFNGRLHTSAYPSAHVFQVESVSRREHPLLIAFRMRGIPRALFSDEPFSDLPEAFRWYRFQFYCVLLFTSGRGRCLTGFGPLGAIFGTPTTAL